jgi:hypothetical protein
MTPPSARSRRARAAALLLPLALLPLPWGVAAAQTLASSALAPLLPANVVAAFGLRDGAAALAHLQPLAAAWREAGMEAVLEALVADGGEFDALSAALLGREAFVAISADRFAPLPAVTLLALADAAGSADIATRLAAERAAGATALREGAFEFTLLASGIAVALDGEFVAASSSVDALRAVLRLRGGAAEGRWEALPGVTATLATLPAGFAFAWFDPGALARAIAPLTRGLGFDASVARLTALLETPGPTGIVAGLDAEGAWSVAVRQPPRNPPDRALHALLSDASPPSAALRAALPHDANDVAISGVDVAAWFAYLQATLADLREVGVPDLRRTLRDLTGVDVERDFLAWTAPGFVSIGNASAQALTALGVIGIPTRDDVAAAQGLTTSLTRVSLLVAAFAGSRAAPRAREGDVAGVRITTFDLLPDLQVAFAVHGGVAWIASSEAALARVIASVGAGANAQVAAALAAAPEGAWGASVGRLALAEAAGWGSALADAAALAGGDVDAAAIAAAAERVAAFLAAIAPRIGVSVAHSGRDAEGRWQRIERTALDLTP